MPTCFCTGMPSSGSLLEQRNTGPTCPTRYWSSTLVSLKHQNIKIPEYIKLTSINLQCSYIKTMWQSGSSGTVWQPFIFCLEYVNKYVPRLSAFGSGKLRQILYTYSTQNINDFKLVHEKTHYHIIFVPQHCKFMLENFMYSGILIF